MQRALRLDISSSTACTSRRSIPGRMRPFALPAPENSFKPEHAALFPALPFRLLSTPREAALHQKAGIVKRPDVRRRLLDKGLGDHAHFCSRLVADALGAQQSGAVKHPVTCFGCHWHFVPRRLLSLGCPAPAEGDRARQRNTELLAVGWGESQLLAKGIAFILKLLQKYCPSLLAPTFHACNEAGEACLSEDLTEAGHRTLIRPRSC